MVLHARLCCSVGHEFLTILHGMVGFFFVPRLDELAPWCWIGHGNTVAT